MAARIHPSRLKRATELRRQGLNYTEIGRVMGVNTTSIAKLLNAAAQQDFACRMCAKKLERPNDTAQYRRQVLCVDCLVAMPNPCFADRLTTHRVEAGYSMRELAKLTEMVPATLRALEESRAEPSWRFLVAAVKVLGMNLLLLPPLGPAEFVRRRMKKGELGSEVGVLKEETGL